MAYKRVTEEEFMQWAKNNPGQAGRINGQEIKAPVQEAQDLGFIGNILRGVTKPVRAVASMPEYLIQSLAAANKGQTGLKPGEYKSIFLTPEEEANWAVDPVKQAGKSVAGLGSYLIPGGGGTATTTAGRIGTAGARGLAAGTVGGYGYSREGKEVEDTLKGAGIGAVSGAALQGLGEIASGIKLKKTTQKLEDMADDLKTTAYKKKIGVAPTAKQGKYDLVRDSMKLANKEGVKINNADDLYQFSDELFNKYGSVANDMADVFDNTGGQISVDLVKKPLIDKLATIKTQELKQPYQAVLDSINNATAGKSTIGAKELLNLKREWGTLGNWNNLTPTAEKSVAQAWEQAFNSANNVLDDSLTGAGLNGFRDVNKALSTAIEQQNWARRAAAYKTGGQVWTDMAQDATMFATAIGGGPGSILGFLGSKGLQSQGENIAAKGLETAAKVTGGASKLPGIIEGLAGVGQRAIPAATMPIQGQQSTQQMQQPIPQQTQAPQPAINELALVQAVLNGQLSTTEANMIMDMFGGQGQQELTANQSKATALQSSLNNLQDIWSQAGIGAKIGEALPGQGIGSASRVLDNAKRAVAEDLGRLQSQGAINEAERQDFLKRLPNVWDSPEVAQQKFASIQNIINSYLPGNTGGGITQDNLGALNSILGL